MLTKKILELRLLHAQARVMSLREQLNKVERNVNPYIQEFLGRFTVSHKNEGWSSRDLYEEYLRVTHANQYVTHTEFGRQLRRLGIPVRRKTAGMYYLVNLIKT